MNAPAFDNQDPSLQPESAQNELHLMDYVAVVLQRWPVALGIFILVAVLTVLYAWTRTPRYTATSRLLLESRGANLTAMRDALDQGRLAQDDIMQTHIQLLTSPRVMEAVLQSGILAKAPEFLATKNPVQKLTRMVKASPAKAGYVLDVSVEHENPELAAEIVNTVVDSYLARNRERRLSFSDGGIIELRQKADQMRTRLAEQTAALQSFMESNRMVSFEDAQNIVVDRLKGLNKNLMAAEPVRMQAESRYLTAKTILEESGGSPIAYESIPGVQESPRINAMKAEMTRLQQQYSDVRDRLGKEHQQIKSLTAQIDALNTQMLLEVKSIVAGLRGKYEQALNEETMLREELDKQEDEVLRFNDLAARYNLLKQSRDSLQETYNAIIHRIDELDVNQLSSQGENISVESYAEVPLVPSWPSKKKMLLIGLFFGALLGIGFCFFLDYMDTTIKTETDVRTYIGQSIIGGIPSAEDESGDDKPESFDLYSVANPRSNFAESFRTIRTALAFTSADSALRSLAITSVFPSEGKSLIAINLAIAYANVGKRTLLVDTDMRKPRLQHVFPGGSKQGIADLLAADSQLEPGALIQPTSVDNLFFLPAGTIPPNPVELLDSSRFDALLARLKSDFEMVIFDAPPSLSMADSMILGKRTDGILLVARAFSTNKFAARQVAQKFQAARVRVLGVLLNNVDAPSEGYYSYYSHYSYYKYYQYGENAKQKQGLFSRILGGSDKSKAKPKSKAKHNKGASKA
ncbi:MAG: polysaccharide biosynthesis tyrosine autokinase [Kiritimatiellae bacterium]|nr:polysaccharide biosynthesis tyrosine autokinase [Kiritimatiellia bacterium]